MSRAEIALVAALAAMIVVPATYWYVKIDAAIANEREVVKLATSCKSGSSLACKTLIENKQTNQNAYPSFVLDFIECKETGSKSPQCELLINKKMKYRMVAINFYYDYVF
ncbi:hypothetical protein [Vibrio owensii]|uniref:hypothetical protein n=1 Tax=Vibrio owensii TaxID=696485 RepID=UPI003CC614DB